MGKIFCIIGKSSSGKDSLFRMLEQDYPNMRRIVLYTTRPIRTGEIDDVTYHYVDDETYYRMKEENKIIEARSYHTEHGIWTYFTSSQEIDLENNNYLQINTLEGYQKLKDYFGVDKVVPIYIEVKDDGVRLQRALTRERSEKQPKYQELCRRFLADQIDFSEEKLANAEITEENRFLNHDFMSCLQEIEEKINDQLSLTKANKQYQL